jgi:hypothetical protein
MLRRVWVAVGIGCVFAVIGSIGITRGAGSEHDIFSRDILVFEVESPRSGRLGSYSKEIGRSGCVCRPKLGCLVSDAGHGENSKKFPPRSLHHGLNIGFCERKHMLGHNSIIWEKDIVAWKNSRKSGWVFYILFKPVTERQEFFVSAKRAFINIGFDVGSNMEGGRFADVPYLPSNSNVPSRISFVEQERRYGDRMLIYRLVDRDPRSLIGLHNFGLLAVHPILEIANQKQSAANYSGDYEAQHRRYFTKGAFFAIIVGAGMAFVSAFLGFIAYSRRALWAQIFWWSCSIVIAFVSAPVSVLVTHRLFIGNWGFLFSASFDTLNPVLPHSLGISV